MHIETPFSWFRDQHYMAAIQSYCSLQAKGNAAFAAGDFDKAIEHFTAGIEVDATNHVLFSNRSAAQVHLSPSQLLSIFHVMSVEHISTYRAAQSGKNPLRWDFGCRPV